MPSAMSAELARLHSLVQKANLAADVKHTALWGLDQLSKLYADLVRTDESRFADAILRLARGLLHRPEGGRIRSRESSASVPPPLFPFLPAPECSISPGAARPPQSSAQGGGI